MGIFFLAQNQVPEIIYFHQLAHDCFLRSIKYQISSTQGKRNYLQGIKVKLPKGLQFAHSFFKIVKLLNTLE